MKRIIFLICVFSMLLCFFTIGASAESAVTDTFYVVSSQESPTALELKAQGKDVVVLSEIYASTKATAEGDWITSFTDGDHIELIFAENIIESVGTYTGILLDKAITLTVRYNGFVHLETNRVDKENTFVLKHSGAKINLIGTSKIYDENGDVITDFTYSTTDLEKNMLQIHHSKVYCWIYDGDAYVENIRASTGQELIFTTDDNSTAEASYNNTYEFVDCALHSGTTAVGLEGRDNARKYIKITGGYYSKVLAQTVLTGSYIKNCELGSFSMDCWSISNQMLVFENATITGKITTATGRTHLSFYDCNIDTAKLSLGGDGAGSSYALVYTAADCENDGTLNVYKQGKGATPVNDDSKYAQTVVDFYADPQNKAFGHTYGWEYIFEGDKYLSSGVASNACATCGDTLESQSLDTMFVSLGYSVPEFGANLSITLGFKINTEAIKQYEALSGTALTYGFVVALEERIGAGVCPLDQSGEAIILDQGNVIKVDLSSEPNSYADLKVSLPKEHADTTLLMCNYIIEAKGEELAISYAQNGAQLVENGNFTYVSYNNH